MNRTSRVQSAQDSNPTPACLPASPRTVSPASAQPTPDCSTRPPREPAYWLTHHRPGWISRTRATEAVPLQIAAEIHLHALEFLRWLELPAKQRWDNLELQELSALLFSRYQVAGKGQAGPLMTVELSALHWPPDSRGVQARLAELQEMLIAPFSVFKAVRLPVCAADFPTPSEVNRATEALQAVREDLTHVVTRLGTALADQDGPPRPAPDRWEAPPPQSLAVRCIPRIASAPQ